MEKTINVENNICKQIDGYYRVTVNEQYVDL